MLQKHHLQGLVEPVVESSGYELVRILTVGSANPTIQVMIDRKDGKDITVADCAKTSRAISAMLDEKDPIDGNYSLEVSSPGIDRPLTKLEHFKRFIGFDAKIETKTEVQKRKRFKGKLLSVDGATVKIEMEEVEYSLPFAEMNKAKLVLTDELFKLHENNLDDNFIDDEE